MKVGFLVNQLDTRGTGNAVVAYGKYNEEILGNESAYFTFANGNHDLMFELFALARNITVWDSTDIVNSNLDVLYHIKSGQDDGFRAPEGVRYVVHSVFDYRPHGDRYAMISEWLGRKYNAPWVPHIIDLMEHNDDYRAEFGIPSDALIFGRHGAADTFDIDFAWDAIFKAINKKDDIYFVFLNTDPPKEFKSPSNRIFFLPKTVDPYQKRKFLNTCDVMIHARERGETFGIAVGEFSVLGKPIITYNSPWERAHISGSTYVYSTEEHLVEAFMLDWKSWGAAAFHNYIDCTPEKVMQKFKKVFLD